MKSMATITVPKKELTREIKTFIVRAVNEVINDPDFGLELSEKAKKRLHKQLIKRKPIPFSEIKKRYY